MSNEEIYFRLRLNFNLDEIKTFSLIQYKLKKMLYEEDFKKLIIPSENQFDYLWWKNKYKELKKIKNGS